MTNKWVINMYVPRGNRIWKEDLLVPICSTSKFIEGVDGIFIMSRKFVIKVRGGHAIFDLVYL